jgi:CheY-like chemotaxis protein
LTISRRFAEMMRGSIGVSSTLGVGSVFDFRFVAERAGGLQEPTVEAKSRVVGVATLSGEIRVLVADGDLPSVGFLSELLERVGFAVRSACDGAGAIAVCRSWQPHCVIIDAKMPVIDGAEATAEMRQSPEGRDIPILMVSAGGEAEGIAIARACGASGFLRKPVREEDLLTLMGERLGIDLVYSQPSEAGPRRDDRWSREQVASAIPVALREELRDALEGGYVDRIAAAIGRVGQLQPELARMLTELAETFEYESILSLLAGGHLVGDEQST